MGTVTEERRKRGGDSARPLAGPSQCQGLRVRPGREGAFLSREEWGARDSGGRGQTGRPGCRWVEGWRGGGRLVVCRMKSKIAFALGWNLSLAKLMLTNSVGEEALLRKIRTDGGWEWGRDGGPRAMVTVPGRA